MIEQIKAFWKYLLSFKKYEWGIRDYPLRIRCQKNVSRDSKCVIQIINWWTMTGIGETREKAASELMKNLENYRIKNQFLPRPGTKAPLQFASAEQIEKYPELIEDFMTKILGFNKNDPFFISDKSSLWNFHCEKSNEQIFLKIKETYGIDVSDIESGNLAEILKRIKNKSKS